MSRKTVPVINYVITAINSHSLTSLSWSCDSEISLHELSQLLRWFLLWLTNFKHCTQIWTSGMVKGTFSVTKKVIWGLPWQPNENLLRQNFSIFLPCLSTPSVAWLTVSWPSRPQWPARTWMMIARSNLSLKQDMARIYCTMIS